jgi:hypothetical protein
VSQPVQPQPYGGPPFGQQPAGSRQSGSEQQPADQPSAGQQSVGPQPGGRSAPGEADPKLPWAKAIAVTVAAYLVVGVIGGWAWQQFSPLAKYTVDQNGGSLGEEQMTRIFGPDGTFTTIGFVGGIVVGGALFWWLRNYGPWSVGIVTIGAVFGSSVTWCVGMLLGHNPLQPRLEAAKPGDLLAAPLELHTWVPLTTWLVGAALAAAVIAASSWRSEPVAATPPPVTSDSSPQAH